MSEMPTLDAAQQAAIEAFLQMDSGLVTLGSVPGAGKSTTGSKLAAEVFLEWAAKDDLVPHQRVVSLSFSKEDASQIIPDVIAWIETLYERGEAPSSLSEDDISELIHQIREASQIGTVDSLLRSVFTEIATELGFDGMPTVGNKALNTRLHRDVCEWIDSQPEIQDQLGRLREAYPSDEYSKDVVDLLRESFIFCRRQNLDISMFKRRLKESVRRNYCGGKPTSFDDILKGVRTYRGSDIVDDVRCETTADTKSALLEEDQRLYDAWLAIIDDLATVLDEYITRYNELCFDRGIVSHLDCSYWVNHYFVSKSDSHRCRRLLQRYHDDIESVIIDEAQDVSRIQHDALSHLINAETRVFLAGDLQQCIYNWRDASPDLFRHAIEDGTYFGETWSNHTAEIADQNYRSRPGIVRFVNAVADRTLNHPRRGGLMSADESTPSLHANRESTDGPSLHVARFMPRGRPGTDEWAGSDGQNGEAQILVSYVAGAIENGRLTTDHGELPSITVLFDTRRQMDVYRSAFEDAGFSVADASSYLFDSPVVCAVVAVLEWLSAPTDPAKTENLLTASPLAGDMSESTYASSVTEFRAIRPQLIDVEWSVSEASRVDTIDDDYRRVLSGLSSLVDDSRQLAVEPAAVVVREIIDRLQLEADPLNLDQTTDRRQRTATLDRFVSLVEEWEDDDRYTPRQLYDLLEPFVEKPKLGPLQPVADDDCVDVVFKTIHSMKGDQDDIVILADPTTDIEPNSYDTTRIATANDEIAIAPPENVLSECPPQIPVISEQLYAPDASSHRSFETPNSAGIRWRAEYWYSTDDQSSTNTLLGPPVRRDNAAAKRAESWRKLYVALTRACEHLILPIPKDDTLLSNGDYWTQVLYNILGEETLHSTGIQSIPLPDGTGEDQETQVVINDVPFDARHDSHATLDSFVPLRSQNVVPTDSIQHEWLPRFLRPSMLGYQVDDPVETIIPVLRGGSPHIDTDAVSSDLPLTFETITTEEVGTVVHELVVRLIEADIGQEALQSPADPQLVDIVEKALAPHASKLGEMELEGLKTFLYEWVLPDLRDSALWERVTQATNIYTEEPLQALSRIKNVDIEVHGQADLLLEMGGGTWSVEDLKTTLTSPSKTQLLRSKLQVDTYAWVLDQQCGSDERVIPRVTTVGVDSNEYTIEWQTGAWRKQLASSVSE